MEGKEEFRGLYYHYLHSKLKESNRNGIISIKEAKKFLFEWRLPSYLRVLILKELELLSLLKKVSRRTYDILPIQIDLTDYPELYKQAGLYPPE
jgi:hypothetical protein